MIRRTACCLCLSLILGLLYGRAGQLWYVLLFVLFLCCLAMGIIKLWNKRRSIFLLRVLCCLCLFAAGALHMQAQQSVRKTLEAELTQGQELTVQGQICRKEEKNQQFIYYLTDTRIVAEGEVYPSYGVLIYSSDGQYQPGNVLKVQGRYEPFQISRNEGNFNEKQYQQSRKWEFRVFAEAISFKSAKENKYMTALKKIQYRIRSVFENSMESEDAGVMANLTLGDKSLMDQEIRELYQRGGISHILAISGLHVSLLGMGLFRLLKIMGCSQKLGALFSVTAVISFGFLSGMEVSTVRALGMFGLLMAAKILGYSYDSLTALSLTAMVQLWDNPFLLEYAGFLFSYGAVLGVSLVYRVFQNSRKAEEEKQKKNLGVLQKTLSKIRDTIAVSLCIQLAILPLSLYFYYEMSVYSIVINACILPFLGILLFLGVVGGIVGSILPPLGRVILTPAGWILGMNQGICQAFLQLPAAEHITGRPDWRLLITYYGILSICLYLVWRRKEKRWSVGIGAALICLIFIRPKPQFEINVLDVGQGDGSLIQTEYGESFFVDGGSSDVKKLGQYRILPFLKYHGIRSVKGWIVSHADSDHISGLKEVLQRGYSVEYLILAAGMARDEAVEDLLELAEEAGCRVVYVEPGMKFGTGDTVFTVLAPECRPKDSENGEADRNDLSLVAAVRHQDFTAIFTGDIGSRQEQNLLETDFMNKYGISSVDFYKAAHHGSDGSNSQEFLQAISPRMTVISCAKKNSYGHPGTEALERIEESGSKIFCTMDQGQIRVVSEAGTARVWTYLP